MFVKRAFTMIELIFVIVILAIIGGIIVIQIGDAQLNSAQKDVRMKLEDEARLISDILANRLQYAIGDSMVYFRNDECNNSLQVDITSQYNEAIGWIGVSQEARLGEWNTTLNYYQAGWNGFVDLIESNTSKIVSSGSNLSAAERIIKNLSDVNLSSGTKYATLYFPAITTIKNACKDFNWTLDSSVNDNPQVMYKVQKINNTNLSFTSNTPQALSEHYLLAHSAYAIKREGNGNLTLYSNFRPWDGEKYTDTDKNVSKTLLGKNVSRFGFYWDNGLVRVNVCVSDAPRDDSNTTGVYAKHIEVCREKTVFSQ